MLAHVLAETSLAPVPGAVPAGAHTPLGPLVAAKTAFTTLDVFRLGWTDAYAFDDTWLIALDDRVEGPIRTIGTAKVAVLSRAWADLLTQATGQAFRRTFPPVLITDVTVGADRLRMAGATHVLGTRGDMRPWIDAQTAAAKARYDVLRAPPTPPGAPTPPIYRRPLFWAALGTAGLVLLLVRRSA